MSGHKFGLSMAVALGLVGIGGVGGHVQDPSVRETTALHVFEARLADYMAVHQRLEQALPPLRSSPNIATVLARHATLATAVKGARPNARQGDLFTTEVAGLFRRLIARALEGVDTEALLADLYDEDAVPSNVRVRVHDRYPAWATREMPPVLLDQLPNLPAGLRYQLFDHDLVLWDVDPDLVVDILPEAIARASRSPSSRCESSAPSTSRTVRCTHSSTPRR